MITLRMTHTVDGSLNGRDVTTYERGSTYELPDQGPGGLADVFLREGWAEEIKPVECVAPVVLTLKEPETAAPAPRPKRKRA